MRVGKYILPLILICVGNISAAPVVTPGRLPAKHYAANFNSASSLIESACQNLRGNSPFAVAEIEQEDADDGEIKAITKYAERFLGMRYRLGASGPKQFDCSGFVGYVFRNFGYKLHRDSRSQFLQGDKVDRDNLKPGDLLFFSSRSSGKGRVGHVALVVDVNDDGSCTFIHASSSKRGVVYQRFPDNGYYSRHYIGAKRIVGSLKNS